MNVCIKSISDNYCWSSGRSSSIYFRRQITTSDLWGMGWFCSWSIFKPRDMHFLCIGTGVNKQHDKKHLSYQPRKMLE